MRKRREGWKRSKEEKEDKATVNKKCRRKERLEFWVVIKPKESAQHSLPVFAPGMNYSSPISSTMVQSQPRQQPKDLLAQTV